MIRAILLLFYIAFLFGCNQKEQDPEPKTSNEMKPVAAQYVGATACASCHEKEYKLWNGSDHQLAMQEAKEGTVLGNFQNATFSYNGVVSTFYRKDGQYYVRTDGVDGKLHDYKIEYAFGIRPLQQYLIRFPGGRFQVLSIAWDTRPRDEGGQRWFHLYPDEKIDYRDDLHWTGLYQNWNHQCAECHSTNLKKNYDEGKDQFQTTWAEINVACEQCHGPGSNHVSWAKNRSPEKNKGLQVLLNKARLDFPIRPETGNPVLLKQTLIENGQVEACAQCHSRRTTIREPYVHGKPLVDTHLPVLLEEDLYYTDGQVRDEVYEYDSFLQSKMFAQGVSCTNCHDPHSAKTTIPDSRICAQCHMPEKFQTTAHHHHKPDSAGADCVSCHMPMHTFMVIDQRRDHSFRVPRPDLTVSTGTRNACNDCHTDRKPQWAAKALEEWYGKQEEHFGEIIQGSRQYKNNYESSLAELVENRSVPGVVRATSLVELGKYLSERSLNAVAAATSDTDPLLRLASISVLESLDQKLRLQLAFPLLKDPFRAIRVRAVAVVATVPQTLFSPGQKIEFDRASKEYVEVQKLNADRPDGQMNLGLFYSDTGSYAEAEAAYLKAIRIRPSTFQAYVNLADLYRLKGDETKSEATLRKALEIEPDNAEANHALGLLLVRRKLLNEALTHLAIAAKKEAYYAYVYGVALNSAGNTKEAINVLKSANKKFPANREILLGIITLARDSKDGITANKYAEQFYKLYPTQEKNN